MDRIDTIERFEQLVKLKSVQIMLFVTKHCSTCKSLSYKLKDLDNAHELDIESLPSIYSFANVYSAPTIIIYFAGKEMNRFSGVFSLEDVYQYINRVKQYVCT